MESPLVPISVREHTTTCPKLLLPDPYMITVSASNADYHMIETD
jgi:hypothetical protein